MLKWMLVFEEVRVQLVPAPAPYQTSNLHHYRNTSARKLPTDSPTAVMQRTLWFGRALPRAFLRLTPDDEPGVVLDDAPTRYGRVSLRMKQIAVGGTRAADGPIVAIARVSVNVTLPIERFEKCSQLAAGNTPKNSNDNRFAAAPVCPRGGVVVRVRVPGSPVMMRIAKVTIGAGREWAHFNATQETVIFPLSALTRDTTPLLQQMVVSFAAV
jgi:hypothetical protein